MRLLAGPLLRLSVGACSTLVACTSIDGQRRPTLSAEARLEVAEAADAAGDSDLAISMYTAAAAREPSNIDLQLRCADALARNGKVDQARALLTERLRTSSRQPDLIRTLALIDLVAGQPAKAIAGFDQVLATNPADTRALVDKAVALDLQGQHAAAQAIYRQVLATAPDDAATRNDLAVSMMLQGQSRQALETLASLQDADTSPPRLKVNLGILYAATGDGARSRQLLGNRVSDGDLSKLTHALTISGIEGEAHSAAPISSSAGTSPVSAASIVPHVPHKHRHVGNARAVAGHGHVAADAQDRPRDPASHHRHRRTVAATAE
jgi:Flp pilus assembly protein TadD